MKSILFAVLLCYVSGMAQTSSGNFRPGIDTIHYTKTIIKLKLNGDTVRINEEWWMGLRHVVQPPPPSPDAIAASLDNQLAFQQRITPDEEPDWQMGTNFQLPAPAESQPAPKTPLIWDKPLTQVVIEGNQTQIRIESPR